MIDGCRGVENGARPIETKLVGEVHDKMEVPGSVNHPMSLRLEAAGRRIEIPHVPSCHRRRNRHPDEDVFFSLAAKLVPKLHMVLDTD